MRIYRTKECEGIELALGTKIYKGKDVKKKNVAGRERKTGEGNKDKEREDAGKR